MSSAPISILIYGRDLTLLETRSWILEARGYKTFIANQLSQFDQIARELPVQLLILCHSLDEDCFAAATDYASQRWPGIRSLVLARNVLKSTTHNPTQVITALDGPEALVRSVNALVGKPVLPSNSTYQQKAQKGESYVPVSGYSALVQQR